MATLSVGLAVLVFVILVGSGVVVTRLAGVQFGSSGPNSSSTGSSSFIPGSVSSSSLRSSSNRWPHRIGTHLRSRFVLGVPWGTLVVIGFVLGMYLFVQDGLTDPSNPVTIPYHGWSYLYPLGMVTASFTHAHTGHLIGNLAGTLVVAPIAEYVWGHYPHARGSQSFSTARSNPWLRAFVFFPLAVVAVGLFTSLFAVGPVIGFSGVVFAFIGFAVVRYPLTTVLGTAVVQGSLTTVYYAITRPIVVTTVEARPPSAPGWAQTAIQGHAIGLFVGLLLGIVLLYRRGYRPDPRRLWLALVLIGLTKGLWAVYWFRGEGTYVLFRGPGIALVLALALIVTLALTASDRPLPSFFQGTASSQPTEADEQVEGDGRQSAAETTGIASGFRNRIPFLGSTTATATGDSFLEQDELTRRQTAFVVVILLLALLSGPAIPANLFLVDDTATGDRTVSVEDYTIGYDEGVENELVSVIDISVFGETTTLTASGVIVTSSERNIWNQAVSKSQLEFSGEETVTVGGLGWRESVTVSREGWEPVGNETVYQIWLADGDDETVTYSSEPSTADLRLDNRTLTLVPSADGTFELEIVGSGAEADTDTQTTTVSLPAENESVEADGLELVRTDNSLYVHSGETVILVATKERYN